MDTNEKDPEKCYHPGCIKKVNNKQMLCKDHRMKRCSAYSCRKMIYKGTYCAKHKPSGKSDQTKEFVAEL